METFRLSSKIRDREKEYQIRTVNDAAVGTVVTTVLIDGVPTETTENPHPNNISPDQVLSFVQVSHDDKKDEIESLLQAYNNASVESDPRLLYHIGTAFYYKGFYSEAREMLLAVTKFDPHNHQALNFLGMTELALGDFQAAIASAAMAVREKSSYADYRNNYAEALMADEQIGRAIEELEDAVSINMYYSDAYYNLGLTLLHNVINNPTQATFKDELERVHESFHRASLTYANIMGNTFNDGMTALACNDLVKAIDLLQRVRHQKKDRQRREFSTFHMKFILHPNLITEKAVGDRIKALEIEIAANPTYIDLQAELAQCYFEQSRLLWKKGLERLQRVVELNPSLDDINKTVALANQTFEKLADAVDEIVSEE